MHSFLLIVVGEWNDIKKPFSVTLKEFVIDFCFGIYTQSFFKLNENNDMISFKNYKPTQPNLSLSHTSTY